MPKYQDGVIIYHNSKMSKKNIEFMSKDEFMKLSKNEIYEMLHGQLAKQPAKRDVKQRQASKQGTKSNVKQISEILEAKTKKPTTDKQPDVFFLILRKSLCHYVSTVRKR